MSVGIAPKSAKRPKGSCRLGAGAPRRTPRPNCSYRLRSEHRNRPIQRHKQSVSPGASLPYPCPLPEVHRAVKACQRSVAEPYGHGRRSLTQEPFRIRPMDQGLGHVRSKDFDCDLVTCRFQILVGNYRRVLACSRGDGWRPDSEEGISCASNLCSTIFSGRICCLRPSL